MMHGEERPTSPRKSIARRGKVQGEYCQQKEHTFQALAEHLAALAEGERDNPLAPAEVAAQSNEKSALQRKVMKNQHCGAK
jgi:hypothetical protein